MNTSPVGFALYAEEFFLAGSSLPLSSRARGNTQFTPVPYYLYGRALELILKAYLLTTGHSLSSLKSRFGHDLGKLWQAATKDGLAQVLGNDLSGFKAQVGAANKYYKSKAFEYFDFRRWAENYPSLPPLESFREDLAIVIAKTKKHCLDVS